MKQLFSEYMVVSGRKFQVKIRAFGREDFCIFVDNDTNLITNPEASQPVWLWFENESWHFSEDMNSDFSNLIIQKVESLRSNW